MVLTALIANEIDGEPVRRQLVSAILLGTSLAVPKGKDVGGDFKQVPLCRAAARSGAWSPMRRSGRRPPPANTLFGGSRAGDGGRLHQPGGAGGGSGALQPYLTGVGSLIAQAAAQGHRWTTKAAVDTPFVTVPGLLTARCASNEYANYLEIAVHPDPADARADDIPGDLGPPANPAAMWGMHLVDVNVAMGNLVAIVGRKRRPTGPLAGAEQ